MADSNMTKRALSDALKELMETEPFSKISAGDICKKCGMNRKSFYYHFKDKYDLINWIYYTEFLAVAEAKEDITSWGLLCDLCDYFYLNRSFYRKTLSIEGQNSFSEYFRDIVASIFTGALLEIGADEENIGFFVDFYSDAFVSAIKKWLMNKNCLEPQKFVELLKSCLTDISAKIIEALSEN